MRHKLIHYAARGLSFALCLGLLTFNLKTEHVTAKVARGDPVQTDLMDYRDVAELTQTLQNLANDSAHAQLLDIGSSIDFTTNPAHPRIYSIYALRISASTDETMRDDYRKNSILFEAGMHPREWLTTESCLMLAEYLVENAENERSGVPELLSKVDVWIIPLTTPAGRVIDDGQGGDPRHYFSIAPNTLGWRGNGDTQGGCGQGVNVARNFSQGWDSVISTDCTNDPDGFNDDPLGDAGGNGNNDDDSVSNYRGFAPFATQEATALRNFVQNHSISMVVVIHSPDEKIWNLWGNNDVAGKTISELGEWAWRVYSLDDPNLALTRTGVGGGIGQFSAWLAEMSDTAAQPDLGTVRGIQTIFVELPFLSATYQGAYRYRTTDHSNRFHPSGAHVRDLIRGNFMLMAKEMIYQSRSPGCPTFSGLPWASKCPGRDFGLVGAKIGGSRLQTGLLRTNSAGCLGTVVNGRCDRTPVPARDYLPVGRHQLYYRVQNFGVSHNTDDAEVRLTIVHTIHRAGSSITETSSSTQTFNALAKQEAQSSYFTLDIETVGSDYTVTLEVRPAGGFNSNTHDAFDKNDKKVFKFRASQM